MNKKFIFYFVILLITILGVIIQSILFPLFFDNDYMPDISLIILVYFSINHGKNSGQLLGFSSGIVLDSLSGAPFGFNSLTRLIIGYTLGFFHGKIFMDKVFLPSIIIIICSLYKFILYIFISKIYPIELNVNFFTIRYLIEIGLNLILTPFIFLLLNLIEKKLYPIRDRN